MILSKKIIIPINLILSVLLLICLLDMPFGYYQLVRFISAAVFGFYAYYYFEQKNKPMFVLFLSLAFLFQPFVKVSLGREIWNIVDVIIATLMIIHIFLFNKSYNSTIRSK